MAFNFQKRRPDEEPPTIPQQGQQQPPRGALEREAELQPGSLRGQLHHQAGPLVD